MEVEVGKVGGRVLDWGIVWGTYQISSLGQLAAAGNSCQYVLSVCSDWRPVVQPADSKGSFAKHFWLVDIGGGLLYRSDRIPILTLKLPFKFGKI